jgi:hypothetical protein
MGGSESGPGISVKIFVEKYKVFPIGIGLEQRIAPVNGTASIGSNRE